MDVFTICHSSHLFHISLFLYLYLYTLDSIYFLDILQSLDHIYLYMYIYKLGKTKLNESRAYPCFFDNSDNIYSVANKFD